MKDFLYKVWIGVCWVILAVLILGALYVYVNADSSGDYEPYYDDPHASSGGR